MSYQDRNRGDWGDDWFDWLKWLRCEALSLSFSSLYRGGGAGWVSLSSYQSMTSNQCSSFIEDWIYFTCSFLSLVSLSVEHRGGGDQEVIQSIEDVKVNLLLFSCSFVSESKSLRWCFDFTLEYLLDDESSRVGEVVVIDDVAVVVAAAAAAAAAGRQPPTYGILCLLFVCESCIFLFHWERDMIQYNANLSSFQLVTYQ